MGRHDEREHRGMLIDECGDYEPYAALWSPDSLQPIYVGKAVP